MILWPGSIWKRSLLAALAVLPLLVALKASLNVAGFCHAERRFLSEEEIINRVIDDVFASYPPSYYELASPVRTPIEYQSRDEFLRANPDCCVIVPSAYGDASESDFQVPFEFSLFGTNAALVRVIYRVERTSDGTGSSKAMPPGMMRDYRRVTNCGFVTNLI